MKQVLDDSNSAGSVSSLDYAEVRRQVQSLLPVGVEIDDGQNLIELGLDSLQMMRMVNKWRRAGAKVTFAELIAAPRLGDWWALLQKSVQPDAAAKAKADQETALEPEQGQAGVQEKAPFALTDVQYAYWIGRQDDQPLGGVGCHAYLEIDGAGVEPKRLEAAWKKVLLHHPMLRARFLTDGRQEVLDAPYEKPLVVHDLRALSEHEQESELERIRERLSHRKLAVELGEVAGLELSLLSYGRTRLHFDLDLLVADVQSLHIILRDLAAAYARDVKPLAPVDWSFARYLQQETARRAADREEAARYWQDRLASLPGAPGLPLLTKPEMIGAPVFVRRTHCLSEADWTRLQKQAQAYQVTPAMVLLTAYAEVLDRWSTHSEFFINIPLFDRQVSEPGIEDVVADFTNLLLLAVDMKQPATFLERVRAIQSQFHQDVAHDAYSGVQLQRDLARVRQGERDFAPVVFACNLGTPLINEECRQMLGELSYMISQTPQVWLDFQLYEMNGGLLLAWDAVEQLFPAGMIDQMFAAFCELMDWLVAPENDWQSAPLLLSDLAKRRQAEDANETTALAIEPQCLHEAFFAQAQKQPLATALIDSSTAASVTYGELAKQALQVAAYLWQHGVGSGQPVAVSLPRGTDQVVAVLGVVAAGGCYVPVGIGQPAARRERIHQKAGVRYVLTDAKHAQELEWPTDAVVLTMETAAASEPLPSPVASSAESLAYIIFTSGSTGEPKGVEISHAGAWNTIAEINRRYGIGAGDRILAVSSLDFDLSVYDLFGLLGAGGSIVLIGEEARRDAAKWAELVERHQITLWNSVPVLLDMLLIAAQSAGYERLPLRLAMLSGDWIGLDLPERLKQSAPDSELVAMGGATEASIWSNFYDVKLPLPAHWTSIPYGRPLANQAYRVVDSKGRDCPDWVAGELWIGGAGVALGYRGDPALTAERFVQWQGERWYRTGDLGRYWPDGTIEFLGRKDFQVKIRGHRIELGEIETAMKQYPGVRDAVVAAVGDPRGNRHLVGYVVSGQEDEAALFDTVSADPSSSAKLWTAVLKTGAGQVEQWAFAEETDKLDQFPAFWSCMEQFAIRAMCRALKKVGANLGGKASFSLDELIGRCGIAERYRPVVQQWLHSLEAEGFIQSGEQGTDPYVFVREIPDDWLKAPSISEAPSAWESQAQGLITYLQKLDDVLSGLLTGAVEPLSVFFAAESGLMPSELMQALPGAKQRERMAQSVLQQAVCSLADKGQPVRILEIGGRNTALTEALLTVLPQGAAEYTYTDSSAFFVQAAKAKLDAYPFAQGQLLDIEQNPLLQGYEAHQYDVVIAADSLHRAKDVQTAIRHAQKLLVPGGLLVMLELTRNSRVQQVSTAFLEDGFTHLQDERRHERQPLMAKEAWERALQPAFAQVMAFPHADDPANVFGQHVIVAQAPECGKRFNPVRLADFLDEKLPDYMVPTAFLLLDALPLSANGKVDRQALPTPDSLLRAKAEKAFTEPKTPLETELAVIWRELFAVERIGTEDNYFELGGDSLLATRLSALVRNRLGVELSLGKIFEKPTIAELALYVQTLVEAAEQAAQPVESLPQIVPAQDKRQEPFPLTDIQQAYWLGRSGVYALGNVSTHCYFEIDGQSLDLERIEAAWQRLIDQHEMMRAVFLPNGLHQQILPQVPRYRIAVNDLRAYTEAAEAEALLSIREEMSHQVLATDVWPLFDVRASHLRDGRVRLHISFDNLIFDGWSMFHLLSEWTRLYHQPDAPLPQLSLSFRDYVLALEDLKATELYKRDLEYWTSRLDDLPPAPQLPLAQNPDTMTEQRFGRLEARLERQTWQRLKERAAEFGLTPSGVLLTAYAETLGAWSRSNRFTINLTQFNRLPLHPEVNALVGDFTTLTLLAVELGKGSSILERGRNLQEQLWRDLDHSLVGGVQVQRELAKQSGEHHGVSMPVVFTSALGVDQWSGGESGGKWLGKLVYNITQTPQVWLDHQVVEQDGELLLIWDSVEGLFPDGMLQDMFTAYCQLLHRLTDEKAAWQEQAQSLIAIPRLEARRAANATDAPISDETLGGLFAKQINQRMNQPAVVSSGRTLTYGELAAAAQKIGKWLSEQGAAPDTLVAVVMEKGWEQVAATLGILAVGAAYLPIDPAHPEERRAGLLRDGQVRFVLTQSWLDETLGWPDDVCRLAVDRLSFSAAEGAWSMLTFPGRPEDLAYVIYTSGSTGMPKGVMIDHRGAVNTILDVNKRFAVGADDKVLALSNLNFDLSVYDVFGLLAAGGTIVMPDATKAKDPAHWIEWLEAEQVTVWNTVPALMQMLVEYASGQNARVAPSLRLVLLSGDWIPLDLPDKIKAYFPQAQVIGLGGATEASIWSNLYPIEQVAPEWKSIPYGRPMVNQRFHVLDEWMNDCPVWVPGQLYIAGIGLAKGYWRDEEKTNDKFVFHPRTGERLYRTGDLGRYLPDGNLEFLGREDFQVKIRGHRIELGEIETVLKRLDGVKEAIAAVPDEAGEEKRLVGYIVLDKQQATGLLEEKAADPAFCDARFAAISDTGKTEAAHVPQAIEVETVQTFLSEAESISTAYMCRTLEHMGAFSREGESYLLDELMQRLQIHPRYRSLLRHWLEVLTAEGILEKAECGAYRSIRALGAVSAERSYQTEAAMALEAVYSRDYPLFIGLLTGELDPLELFLAEEAFLTPAGLSQFDLTREYYQSLTVQVLGTIASSHPSQSELRVLEIGTRAGSMTQALVAALPAERSKYLYADESSFFTDRAKQAWGEAAPFEYGQFDMNVSPLAQGYEPHSFDVIVADNTLHRARNLESTLAYLQELLAPGGILLLVESTRNSRLLLTTVGFFEDGFSHLEDERKASELPLLAVDQWRELLARHGFTNIAAFPGEGMAAEVFERHLIVAQAPQAVKVFVPEKLADAVRQSLPDYMVPSGFVLLDKLPLSANGKVDRKALAQLGQNKASLPGKAHVAPVSEIQTIIASVWEEVLGSSDLGLHDNFFMRGGDSLRAIQCLNLLKERHQLELSLQNLFEAPTLGQLAAFIEANIAESGQGGAEYDEGTI